MELHGGLMSFSGGEYVDDVLGDPSDVTGLCWWMPVTSYAFSDECAASVTMVSPGMPARQ